MNTKNIWPIANDLFLCGAIASLTYCICLLHNDIKILRKRNNITNKPIESLTWLSRFSQNKHVL